MEQAAGQSNESPIIVSGSPRSGTTWMQAYLSQHPAIHIHGQPPGHFPWSLTYDWYQGLVQRGEWALASNADVTDGETHYAGSDRNRCGDIIRRMYRDYMTGFGTQTEVWGLKYIGLCSDPEAVEQFEELWPGTRWIVGIRDPVKTFESIRNTFLPDADLVRWLTMWVDACRFVEQRGDENTACFQIDALRSQSGVERITALTPVWECIGEEPSVESLRFIRDWPTIHKVTSDSDRTYRMSDDDIARALDEVPDLGRFAAQFGYDFERRQPAAANDNRDD